MNSILNSFSSKQKVESLFNRFDRSVIATMNEVNVVESFFSEGKEDIVFYCFLLTIR